MSSETPNVVRAIAEKELDACFHDLSQTTRTELTTSLVRQWLTNDGTAVIATRDHHFWFRMSRLNNGTRQVVREVQEGTFSQFMRRSRVIEEQIPSLLHELNLRQSTYCFDEHGEMLHLSVDPAQKLFAIELVPDEDRSA